MALKNLFDMAKADRYTADGREALIKAQEAETEDKVYQIGEISQKTGLQKTANGWVKPKSGKQPGAKKENPTRTFEFKSGPDGMPVAGSGKEVKTYKTKKEAESALKKQNAAPANKTTIRQGPNTKTLNETPAEHVQKNLDAYKGYQPYDMEELVLKPSGYERQTSARVPGGGQSITYTKNGAEDITLFFDKHGELENADIAAKSKPAAEKPERFDYRSSLEKNPRDAFSFKGTVTHSIPTNQYHYDELQNLASFMREEKATYQNALRSRAQALVDGHRANGDWEPKKEQALMDIAKAVGFDEELHNFIAEENRGYDLGYSEDAAPSLSEIVDRVYNIGEISEKTGLQKTANGWRPVKKGAAGKTSRSSKEEAIRKDLGLTEGEDMSRFSDEQIETMYAKTQQTPEQQKADFDKSKIGQAMNKHRAEYEKHKVDYKASQHMRDAEKEMGVAESLERMYAARGMDTEAAAAREYRNAAETYKALNGEVANLPRNQMPDAELQQKLNEAKARLEKARVNARPESKPAANKPEVKKQDFSVLSKNKMKFRWDQRDDGSEGFLLEEPGGSQVFVDEKDVIGEYPNYTIKPGSAIHEALNLHNSPFKINVGEAGGNIRSSKVTNPIEMEREAGSKPAESKPDGVDEEGNIKIPKAGMNVLVKVNGNRPGKIVSSRGDYVEVEMPARGTYPGRRDTYYKSDLKFDEEMKADALERSDAARQRESNDSAPRVLTGDTRIRVRKA